MFVNQKFKYSLKWVAQLQEPGEPLKALKHEEHFERCIMSFVVPEYNKSLANHFFNFYRHST